ncbi:hypothetical protein V6N11_011098 [Hibiscus sabdariffa]|uniref:DUF4283 domain-containing protein n=1 Tax=Hibiscus sabdariffa TaxID=183260 RepID=A0ABR2S7A2_9ROSI
MAYGNGRSSFWRKKRNSVVVEKRGIESQRPMLMEEVSIKMAQSNRQTEQEGEVEETTQQKENIRVITGFVDDEKLELLSRCALGFCRKPQQIMDLANEFLRADLVGFKIMGVVGSLVLLIFQSLEERKRMLESAVLDTWLENVMEWSPTIAMPNRRVWISACGIPIHAWSVGTFQNLAALWGELVKVGDRTLDLLNFETARFLVETDWFYRIEEIVGLTGEEESGEDRQQDVKDAISPTLCSVDLGLGQFVHAFDVSKSVVPESPKNTGSPIWHMNRLWEDNMVEDWRVLELPNAESGEVGNAMIMAEVGEPGLEIPIEVLEPSERSMELIDVGPRSEMSCMETVAADPRNPKKPKRQDDDPLDKGGSSAASTPSIGQPTEKTTAPNASYKDVLMGESNEDPMMDNKPDDDEDIKILEGDVVDKRQRRPIHKPQTKDHKHTNKRFMGSRFNPIYEDDEDLQTTEGLQGVEDVLAPSPTKNTRPDHKQKGKQPTVYKHPRAIHVRKPLQVTLNDFPIVSRFTSKGSSSRSVPSTLKTSHLDKSRHSAVVLSENTEPSPCLVIDAPGNHQLSDNPLILSDPPDTHTNKHPNPVAFGAHQDHAKPGIKAIEPVDTYEADMLD